MIKGEGTRIKENDLDIALRYDSWRSVSNLHP